VVIKFPLASKQISWHFRLELQKNYAHFNKYLSLYECRVQAVAVQKFLWPNSKKDRYDAINKDKSGVFTLFAVQTFRIYIYTEKYLHSLCLFLKIDYKMKYYEIYLKLKKHATIFVRFLPCWSSSNCCSRFNGGEKASLSYILFCGVKRWCRNTPISGCWQKAIFF